jgi:hypothetical protein
LLALAGPGGAEVDEVAAVRGVVPDTGLVLRAVVEDHRAAGIPAGFESGPQLIVHLDSSPTPRRPGGRSPFLADPADSEAHFDKALADPAGDQWPFERAQLRLDHAEWLRRRRRINDAKAVLTEALGTFRRLGARSWAERAQAELRACGVPVARAPGEPDALGELTPQQRQIVRLAIAGLTDREIGDRHQLRDVIADASMSAAPPSSASVQ